MDLGALPGVLSYTTTSPKNTSHSQRKKLTLHTPEERRKIFLLPSNTPANEKPPLPEFLLSSNRPLFKIIPPYSLPSLIRASPSPLFFGFAYGSPYLACPKL